MAVHRTHRRFEWIAQHYDEDIVRHCVSTLLEALGEHDRATITKLSPNGTILDFVHRRLPAHTRFNRYLPWLARELHTLHRLRSIQLLHASAGAMTTQGFLSVKGILAGAVLGYTTLQMLQDPRIRHAMQTFEDLQLRFRAIADWAAAERVDLGPYEAQKAIEAAARWRTKKALDAMPQGDVALALDDGWTFQRLTSPDQLEAEGAGMQHCLDQNDVDAVGQIYSLRDPKGLPHATLEWIPDQARVLQVRGKQNVRPRTDYLLRCVQLRRQIQPPGVFTAVNPPDCARVFDNAHQKYLGCWRADPDLTQHLDDELGRDWCVYFVWRPFVLERDLVWIPIARVVPSSALPGIAAFSERTGDRRLEGPASEPIPSEMRTPTGFSWHVLVEHGAFLEREIGLNISFMGRDLVDDHMVASLFHVSAQEQRLQDVLEAVGCRVLRIPPVPGDGPLHVDRRGPGA